MLPVFSKGIVAVVLRIKKPPPSSLSSHNMTKSKKKPSPDTPKGRLTVSQQDAVRTYITKHNIRDYSIVEDPNGLGYVISPGVQPILIEHSEDGKARAITQDHAMQQYALTEPYTQQADLSLPDPGYKHCPVCHSNREWWMFEYPAHSYRLHGSERFGARNQVVRGSLEMCYDCARTIQGRALDQNQQH